MVEYHNKRVREKRKKLIWIFSGILVLLIALVLVSRLSSFQIAKVKVEGAKVITNDEVERNVLVTLAGSYFWLVPKGNAAFYPREEVRASLMKEFPRFSSVGLNVEGENTLRVLVTEREPYALYCPPAEEKCFFLDKEGFVFDEAPDFSGVVYFIYETEVPAEEFKNLSAFIENLSKLGFEPIRFEDYGLTMKNGSHMFLPEKSDLGKLFSSLELFLRSPAVEKDKLSEIDLRTENKIFWKTFGNN